MNLQDFIKKHGNVNVDEKDLKELLGIESEKYFIPSKDERYWFVEHTGDITTFINENNSYDVELFENSEVFRTKKEVEKHAETQRFVLQMKRDFADNSDEIKWQSRDGAQNKYTIYYCHIQNKIIINFLKYENYCGLYTTNYEWLEEYIEKHEEEIKKHYFEIKE